MTGGEAVRHTWSGIAWIAALLLAGCAGHVNSTGSTPQQPQQVTLTMSPAKATLRGGDTQTFTAKTSDGSTPAFTWSVNGVAGGNTTTGTITTSGVYTAPQFPPTSNTVTIGVAETADATKSASSAVTLNNPAPQLVSITPTSLPVGTFTLTATGTDFAPGATILFGTTALTTTRVSATQLTATGTATAAETGNVAVLVQNPDPGKVSSASLMAQVLTPVAPLTAAAAVRMLEQSTFGPTPELVTQVQQMGFDAFLQSQFTAPNSTYLDPAPTDMGLGKVQTRFFLNAVNDSDQLRQRVAFALNEIWVVSQNKVNDPTGYTNYMRALTNDALGNYYDVIKDVTLTPAMGHFLDMVNNDKPGTGQHANENYARELMQLFTLGLGELHSDGTVQVDGSGNAIPTYTQDDVMALGRVLTGWTYPTQPGQTLQKHNPSYYGGPMVPFESNHDSGSKTLLGQPIAAGQSAEQELDAALTIIFNHPNLPPFVSQQLIEKLVTSNPSPAYVARVAAAFTSGTFNSYGSGKRGDMQATLAAILLDPEARRGDSTTTAEVGDGKLREPAVMMVSIARAFHANTDGSGFTGWGGNMSQHVFNSGSVFNFFPPQNLIPGTTLNGPEFAIFNTNTSLARANFINSIVYGQISGATKVDFTPVINAGTPDQMADWLNNLFLHGTTSSSMKQTVVTAVNAVSSTDAKDRARTAIYLVASSSQYQVQR